MHRALKAAGYRIGLASSKPEKSCRSVNFGSIFGNTFGNYV